MLCSSIHFKRPSAVNGSSPFQVVPRCVWMSMYGPPFVAGKRRASQGRSQGRGQGAAEEPAAGGSERVHEVSFVWFQTRTEVRGVRLFDVIDRASRKPGGKARFGLMRGFGDGFNLTNDVWMLGREVVRFAGIGLQVEELPGTFRPKMEAFPISHAHRLMKDVLFRAIVLPVEVGMLLLLIGVAEQGRGDRDAVVLGKEPGRSGQICKCRHHIGEITDVVADRPRLDRPWPSDHERHPDASFVERPLGSLERSVAVKEIDENISPGSRLWAVVGHEEDNRLAIDLQVFQSARTSPT